MQRAPFQMSDVPPYAHQLEIFNKTKDEAAWALLLEMGTGKSRIVIDNAAYLYAQGEIDALLVVAPPGVEYNWVNDELPKHLHPSVKYLAATYSTAKFKTIAHKEQMGAVLNYAGLAVLTISYNAFTTEHGKAFVKQFLTKRKCLYVLDESTRIKTPTAMRTKTILASAPYAKYRRILTGTPVGNGPFDVYTQMKFLDAQFWLQHGFANFTTFKHYFGEFRKMSNPGNGRQFDMLTSYQNLPILQRILATKSFRVTKAEVLDLPEKIYTKRYFEMSTPQYMLYHKLRTEFMAELDGNEIDGALAIVRMVRLQQIVSGYVQLEPDTPITMIGDENPRLRCLEETLEDVPTQAIIWAKFTKDIDLICGMLKGKCVRYDGQVNSDDRRTALDKFRSGEMQYFVANPACAGEGLTLTEAKTVIYYNNTFKLPDRLQSEDRAHRIGQKDNVTYIDIVCRKTIDEHIVKCLVNKQDVACQLTGDALKQWLSV